MMLQTGQVNFKRKKVVRRLEPYIFEETRHMVDTLRSKLTGSREFNGIRTGFTDFDNKAEGFRNGDLILLGGRPGMGKTTLALNIAENVAVRDKITTIYFSLEFSAARLFRKLLFIRAGKPLYPKRQILEDEYIKIFAPCAEELGNSPLLVDDTTGISASEILRRCKAVQDKTKIGLIIIDYLQLMTLTNDGMNDGQYNDTLKDLKKLAVELDCPILLLTQLNRNCEERPDKRPICADLKMEDGAENLADEILFLYREDYYNWKTEDKDIADLIIARNRDASTGLVRLACFWDYGRFDDRMHEWSGNYFGEEEEITDLSSFLGGGEKME